MAPRAIFRRRPGQLWRCASESESAVAGWPAAPIGIESSVRAPNLTCPPGPARPAALGTPAESGRRAGGSQAGGLRAATVCRPRPGSSPARRQGFSCCLTDLGAGRLGVQCSVHGSTYVPQALMLTPVARASDYRMLLSADGPARSAYPRPQRTFLSPARSRQSPSPVLFTV